MNIYERIKSISDTMHLTISSIETECNISNGSISKWKNQIPKADNLYSVAKFLGTSMEYLLTGKTVSNNTSISNSIAGNNNNNFTGINQGSVAIGNNQEQKLSDEIIEIIKIYQSFDVRARNEMFSIILKLEKEVKERESNK